jgi:hypothetical protein
VQRKILYIAVGQFTAARKRERIQLCTVGENDSESVVMKRRTAQMELLDLWRVLQDVTDAGDNIVGKIERCERAAACRGSSYRSR